MKKNWFKFGVAFCISAIILAGCSLGSNKSGIGSKQSTTLKVMAFNEDYFHQEYGMLFSAIYPNIEIEVVNTNLLNDLMEEHNQNYSKALKAFIEQEQPDVISIDDPASITQFIEDGTFLSLDSLVANQKYNAQGLIPGVIDYMKEFGSGNIYTIPTTFSTQVLFYNKDLFDKFDIPYPTDQMTWEEIVSLAKQFPTDGDASERLFGLSMGWSHELSAIVNELANAQGIKYFDSEALQMTIDTPSWAALIEQAIHIAQTNTLFSDQMMYSNPDSYISSDESGTHDAFLNGRLAMKLEHTYYFSQIEATQKYAANPDNIVQNWDIVTAPVSTQRPDSTTYTYFSSLVAINSASTNIDAAQTYISYITGDEFARVKSKLSYGGTPIRTQYLKKDNDRNYEALYKLKPLNNNLVSYYHVPQRFYMEFEGILQQTLMSITEDQITIEQALAELQLKGNELLATKLMTDEEFEQYLQESNMSGVILQ